MSAEAMCHYHEFPFICLMRFYFAQIVVFFIQMRRVIRYQCEQKKSLEKRCLWTGKNYSACVVAPLPLISELGFCAFHPIANRQ